jgi:hypothetical protein
MAADPAVGGATVGRAGSTRRLGFPLMLVAMGSLLLGLGAGLARIGWNLPEVDSGLMLRHGGLMVVGFVGTVIAVERAVALRSIAAFLAPALSAAAGVVLIGGGPTSMAAGFAMMAGVAYSVNVAVLLVRHRQPPLVGMLAGGVCLAVAGAVWWSGGAMQAVAPWWMSFVALTIGAERFEIMRFQRFSRADVYTIGGLLLLLVAGPAVALWDADAGVRLLGVGLLLGPLWLVRRDVARRTVRTEGLARFVGVGVLTAYGWLAVSGLLLVANGWGVGLEYDAVIHAFFVGFVFGAIIAHEPIILPSVTGFRLSYSPVMYAPLVLLHASLVLWVGADLFDAVELRRLMGLVQVLAILMFLAVSAGLVVAGRRQDRVAARS